MRAVQFEQYGGPEVLHLAEAPEPHAGPGQVRIAVRAAAVNPMDWKIRSGAMAEHMALDLPSIPGLDAAGIVDEVGVDVTSVAVGDRVFGNGSAATAEFAVLNAFALVPESLGLVEAAALPVAVETSARVLDLLNLHPGQLIVVDGAAGGVGTTLVQLAVFRGLQVVGTASEGNHQLLKELGAVPTTYGEGLAGRVHALVDGPVAGGIDLAGKGGVADLVVLTGDPGRVVTIADFSAGARGVQVTSGSAGRAFYALGEVAKLIEEGKFRVVADHVFPWTEVARAHELSQSGHVRGKIVLTVDEPA
ncbi:MAG: NADP-dependent oxidoreductase [Actinomycetota bacterium]|nr:NADP-dependent oxidoreductase [Actinomycetota bacterium]